MNLHRTLQRRPAAPDLAPRRPARPGGLRASSTGSPTPGQSWWQMLPLGPPDRHGSPYKAKSAFAAWPGLLADPRAPVADDEELDFRERDAVLDRGLGAFAGAARSPTRSASTASGPRCARYAAERGVRLIGDVPIYVAPGSADHRAHPELFRDDAVAGAPPDAFTDKGQLWGNPLYDWPALRRAATAGGSSASAARSSSSTSRGSTTSAASSPTGRCRAGARHALRRALAARAGARAVRRRRGGARRAAADRRGPRRDHARGRRGCATSLGLPGHGRRCSSGSTPATRSSAAPPGEPRRATASSTPARTTTTRCAAGTTRCRTRCARWSTPRSTRHGVRERDAAVVADPARVRLARAGGDGAGAGRARARLRGAHEHARPPAGAWKWRLERMPGKDLGRRLRAATEASGRV